MAIKKIPCGGWLYDDETITFEDGVMKVIGGGGISEAPIDGKQYARKDAEWSEVQSGGGGMVVNLTFVDVDTPITADKTLLELGEAFSNGRPVLANLYFENRLLVSAQCVECQDPYVNCAMIFGSSIYHSESDSTKFTIIGARTLDDDEETRIDFWECSILN